MIFKNKYGEIRSGWALALLFVVFYMVQIVISIFIGVIVGLIIASSGTDMGNIEEYTERVNDLTASPLVGICMNIAVLLATIGAALLLFHILYKRPLAQMGLQKTGWLRQLLFGCLFGIVAIGLVVVLLLVTQAATLTVPDGARLADSQFAGEFAGGLILFILVGFSEEIFSRGFMMTAMKTTRSKWLILLLPALLFALMHIFNPNVTVLGLFNIMLVGILFAYLLLKTGRLWVPIGFHITWNFFQSYVFGIPVSGMEKPALMQTVFTGQPWLTGGAFGAEGGIICTLVIVLCLVFVHFFMKKPQQTFWSLTSDLPLTRGVKGKASLMPDPVE